MLQNLQSRELYHISVIPGPFGHADVCLQGRLTSVSLLGHQSVREDDKAISVPQKFNLVRKSGFKHLTDELFR